MYILHIPSWFPTEKSPYTGNFIERHIKAIAPYYPAVELKVAPVTRIKERKFVEKQENIVELTYFYKDRNSFPGKVFNAFYRAYLYQKAAKEICKEYGKPDLIHLHVALPLGTFAKKWSKRWGIPLVLTEHWSIYQPKNSDKITPRLQKKLRSIFSSLKAYTTVSENLRNAIRELFPEKISEVIYNVVDLDVFTHSPRQNEKKTIIHISTLDEEAKNFSGILRAVKDLASQRNDFVLKVIHENRSETAEEYVKINHLSDVVTFLGNKNEQEVAEALRNSDFLLLYSNYENLPCVIIESFASGKPVLVTPVGGITEIVDESNGIFTTPKNDQELANKLNYMLDNYANYDSQRIRKYAELNFSFDKIGEQFYDFYRKILEHRD
ncbi:glycosyltransferase family 4 protein [Bacteroidales bacterium OttesenSCG-928-A14]|nr:glycosyltransferase family 4 protein [Bacteroidales bacterium OttesenSCG-928-A14]